MTNKKSFILYNDQQNVFEELSGEECKELILAIFNFSNNIDTELSRPVKIAFLSIKNTLVRDKEKWENNSRMRKEFGKRGGIAKASKSYHKPVLLSKPTVSVSVSDSVINKEKKENPFSLEMAKKAFGVLEGVK
jgi:hypothetical protein